MEEKKNDIVIKIIGVGGGGNNALNDMIENNVTGVQYIAANTDRQALNKNKAENKIILGEKTTKGMGAGSSPQIGEEAAKESEEQIKDAIKGADMIFVTAGMGGGTGTGGAPVIAKIAKDMGILTIGVVTKPFSFEGTKKAKCAEGGIERMKEATDSLIEISNDRVLVNSQKKTGFKESMHMIDGILRYAVSGVTNLINVPGFINLDFNDVKTTLKDSHRAVIGMGDCPMNSEDIGEDISPVLKATQIAVNSPLLDTSIEKARRVILNFASKEDISMLDIKEASDKVCKMVSPDANIIFGTTIDEKLDDIVRVTIIAADYDEQVAKVERVGEDEEENEYRDSDTYYPPIVPTAKKLFLAKGN